MTVWLIIQPNTCQAANVYQKGYNVNQVQKKRKVLLSFLKFG